MEAVGSIALCRHMKPRSLDRGSVMIVLITVSVIQPIVLVVRAV